MVSTNLECDAGNAKDGLFGSVNQSGFPGCGEKDDTENKSCRLWVMICLTSSSTKVVNHLLCLSSLINHCGNIQDNRSMILWLAG